MRLNDVEQLRDEILAYRPEFETPGIREALVETAWPRVLGTLELIPDDVRGGDVLELGATPFFQTLCLRKVCSGRIAIANYFGTTERTGAQELVHRHTGERLRLEYDLFNIEADEFPYPADSFDVIVFSELVEHLAVNPVWALSEMHRVLRPNGVLIVTTPNALAHTRLESYLFGTDQMVDRYSPACGYGARHNREYHPQELRDLLEGTGFVIETMSVRDIMPIKRFHRWHRALWNVLLHLYSRHPREEHIFLRARRTDPFRWHFPPTLFDNVESFALVRYPWMEMGINDAIQCVDGWRPLEARPEGGALRWTRGAAGQVFLKTPAQPRALSVECFAQIAAQAPALSVRVTVWDRWLGRVDPQCVYADTTIAIERGTWRRVEIPLQTANMHAGNEVEVRFEPVAGSSALSERQRALALQRVAIESSIAH
jgi:SAM-dependent methyltransferase